MSWDDRNTYLHPPAERAELDAQRDAQTARWAPDEDASAADAAPTVEELTEKLEAANREIAELQERIGDYMARLAEMDGDDPDPFTDEDIAHCYANMARWRRALTEHPGTYKKPEGNHDVWVGALAVIEAVKRGESPDAAGVINGVSIDGDVWRDARSQRLLLHLCQYALAHPHPYTITAAPAVAQEA